MADPRVAAGREAAHPDMSIDDSYHITALLSAGFKNPGISHGDDGQTTVSFYSSSGIGFYSGTAKTFKLAERAALANGATLVPTDQQIDDATVEDIAV